MRTSVIEVRDLLSILTVEEVEKRIRNVHGVASATVNYAARNATVRFDETRLKVADIKVILHQRGSQAVAEPVSNQASAHKSERNRAVPAMLGAPQASAARPSVPAPAPVPPVLDDAAGLLTSEALLPFPLSTMATVDNPEDPSVRDADEVARALGADIENGLASTEASRRLLADGPNELRSALRQPAWRRFLAHFHDPLVYLLLAAVVIALVSWVVEGMVGWPLDALVIATIVLLNGILG